MSSLIVEVCNVDSVIKHPNADKLSIVGIKGFNCVVGLNQYKVNDLVVFVPPDCIIPLDLIEKYNLEYLKKHGRTETIKLRGAVSQGLILNLPDGNWKVGDDVSGVLNIKKWMPPEAPVMRGVNQTSKKKMNPLFDKYTDIENIKHYKRLFKDGDFVTITEKIHGANARYSNLEICINSDQPFFDRMINLFQKYILKKTHQFVYGSHNVQITSNANRNSFYGTDVWGKIAERYNLAKIIPEDMIIYGEIFGDNIQDLKYGMKNEIDFRVFDIKLKGVYLNWSDVLDFSSKLNLKTVPELYYGIFYDGVIEKYTSGKSLIDKNQMREGIVCKTAIEEKHPLIGRKILKSISEEYLLRKDGSEYQ